MIYQPQEVSLGLTEIQQHIRAYETEQYKYTGEALVGTPGDRIAWQVVY